MKIDPDTQFWLMFYATIGQGITAGTVHLTGLIPANAIPVVTGWISFTVFIVMSFLTLATKFSSNQSGSWAPPPTIPEARAILDQATNAVNNEVKK